MCVYILTVKKCRLRYRTESVKRFVAVAVTIRAIHTESSIFRSSVPIWKTLPPWARGQINDVTVHAGCCYVYYLQFIIHKKSGLYLANLQKNSSLQDDHNTTHTSWLKLERLQIFIYFVTVHNNQINSETMHVKREQLFRVFYRYSNAFEKSVCYYHKVQL